MRAGCTGQHSLFEESNSPSKRYFAVDPDTGSYQNITHKIDLVKSRCSEDIWIDN